MQPQSCLQLVCHHPEVKAEFELFPGTFARIGSSREAEICLPLPGIAEFACILKRANDGTYHLAKGDGQDAAPILLPARISIPPYHFILSDQQATALTPRLRPILQSNLSSSAALVNVQVPPKKKKNKASISQNYLLAVGAVVFLGFSLITAAMILSSGSKSPKEEKSQASQIDQPTPQVNALTPPAEAPQLPSSLQASFPDPASLRTKSLEETIMEKLSNAPAPSPDLEHLVEKVEPCVYLITVKDASGKEIGVGTGFTITPSGQLVTNAHVIENGTSFSTRSASGSTYPIASVINYDEKADLAILQLISSDSLPFLELGNSDDLKTGAPVSVFGSAGGLAGTFSNGVVSAKRAANSMDQDMPNGGKLIQITAPISSGSSGSPVMDRDGKVIGVVSLLITGKTLQNLNFAIPSSAVTSLRNQAPGTLPFTPKSTNSHEIAQSKIEEDSRNDPLTSTLLRLYNKDNYAAALITAKQLSARHPQASYPYYMLGLVTYEQENYIEALSYVKTAITITPHDTECIILYAYCEICLDRIFEAKNRIKKAIQIQPTKVKLYHPLVVTLIISGDTSGAIQALNKWMNLDRTSAEAYLKRMSEMDTLLDTQKSLLSHFGYTYVPQKTTRPDTRSTYPQQQQKQAPSDENESLVTSLARIIEKFFILQESENPEVERFGFHDFVYPFYEEKKALSKAEILPHLEKIRNEWPSRSLKLTEITNYYMSGEEAITVVCRVTYKFSNRTKVRQGEMIQNITLTLNEDKHFRISGIRTRQ